MAGDVKRLSVAVVVDGISDTDASGKMSYKARTPKDMEQIEALVKSAIGYNQTRGDQVQVVNMPFARIDAGPATPAPAPRWVWTAATGSRHQAGILSLTALLIALLVVRPLINRMFAPLTAGTLAAGVQGADGESAGELGAPSVGADGEPVAGALPPAPIESMIDISRIEGQVRASSIKKVGEVVEAHPEEALAIIRTWLQQPA